MDKIALSSDELDFLMKGFKRYKGAVADDQIPILTSGDGCIMNYQGSNESGSHWIALYRKGDVLYNFDSYGFTPDESVVAYAKKMHLQIFSSWRKLQNLTSSLCGFYAVWFLKQMFDGVDLYDVMYGIDGDKDIIKYFT